MSSTNINNNNNNNTAVNSSSKERDLRKEKVVMEEQLETLRMKSAMNEFQHTVSAHIEKVKQKIVNLGKDNDADFDDEDEKKKKITKSNIFGEGAVQRPTSAEDKAIKGLIYGLKIGSNNNSKKLDEKKRGLNEYVPQEKIDKKLAKRSREKHSSDEEDAENVSKMDMALMEHTDSEDDSDDDNSSDSDSSTNSNDSFIKSDSEDDEKNGKKNYKSEDNKKNRNSSYSSSSSSSEDEDEDENQRKKKKTKIEIPINVPKQREPLVVVIPVTNTTHGMSSEIPTFGQQMNLYLKYLTMVKIKTGYVEFINNDAAKFKKVIDSKECIKNQGRTILKIIGNYISNSTHEANLFHDKKVTSKLQEIITDMIGLQSFKRVKIEYMTTSGGLEGSVTGVKDPVGGFYKIVYKKDMSDSSKQKEIYENKEWTDFFTFLSHLFRFDTMIQEKLNARIVQCLELKLFKEIDANDWAGKTAFILSTEFVQNDILDYLRLITQYVYEDFIRDPEHKQKMIEKVAPELLSHSPVGGDEDGKESSIDILHSKKNIGKKGRKDQVKSKRLRLPPPFLLDGKSYEMKMAHENYELEQAKADTESDNDMMDFDDNKKISKSDIKMNDIKKNSNKKKAVRFSPTVIDNSVEDQSD